VIDLSEDGELGSKILEWFHTKYFNCHDYDYGLEDTKSSTAIEIAMITIVNKYRAP
jgi:hypothetical protein